MAFTIPKQPYSGKIGETTVGSGGGAVRLGGEDSYPFHVFEGSMPNAPKIAMEVWDYDPSKEWPAAAVAPFKDVISAPDAWAKKCVKEYGADMIVLQLKSTDPNGMDRGAADAAKVAKKVADAIDVPLVVWGTANNQKDEEVLKKISETLDGKNVALAPVEEGDHKGVGASALGYRHCVVASSPIDVNLAKQLNILLSNLGLPANKLIIDPTTGGLGYGLEYSYSVMERIRMAALTQEDDKLQIPMINNIGNEVWKCKEAGLSGKEAPTLGDPERRAILMEAVSAVCYLMAGSDVVILRHPETVRLVRSYIQLMVSGGMATAVEGIARRTPEEKADLAAISPAPNLDFGEGAAAPKAAAAEAKKKPAAKPEKKEEKAPPAPKAEEKVVKLKPKAEEKPAEDKAEAEARAKAEAEAKAKTQEEAEKKAKAEAEARAKADAEAKAKADAEAKARAEAEVRAKAEKDSKDKEEQELQALRLKRAKEAEKLEAERIARRAEEAKKATPAAEKTLVEKLYEFLDRMHKHS